MFYEFGGTELMKILVLTSVYPQPDDDKYTGVTPVLDCTVNAPNGHNPKT